MIVDLTGMEIANASLLDEATAAAEGMTMAHRVAKSKSDTFFVAHDCHPQTIAVVQTPARPLGIEVVVGDPAKDLDGRQVFAAPLPYPGTYRPLHHICPILETHHAQHPHPCSTHVLMSPTLCTPQRSTDAHLLSRYPQLLT